MRRRLRKLHSAHTERLYRHPPHEVLRAAEKAVRELPRWSLQVSGAGGIRATRRTRVFRFVDEVRIRVEEHPAGSYLTAGSESRVGFWDLGQNRRNLRELLRRLDRELP
ncbi:DUF1499 domain-containing protein [Rubrobacter taiwanensis]|jgi:uncharacterized protein (DUF1499 family)|uniref:DUF1499 domain-containing protein n=1 Tax=Rubrobacter taiwanensis TaxID=185139 RepID=A0A4V2NWS2_9ACTN|nr:DUF1499 domain-containing protein [Rubrobacter taiwanensis]TCJ18462.1 DUF1499 domain-containing protein [Rubrobacter taiwanensis]